VENGKVTIEVAKDIYARTCIDVQRNWSNLSAVQDYRKEKALESYIEDVHRALLTKVVSVPDPPGVAPWKAQYMHVEERYKFLVLCGPSQTGKTMWARTAFGTREQCFEVNCSSGQEPALKSFDFFKDKWILLDEARPHQVLDNKKCVQAQAVPVTMGTSTTNCHAYDMFVHRVPIIIACNDWVELTSKIEKESDKEWLESNSVLIVVLEKMHGRTSAA
jgi:hypothetical protein